MGKIELDWANLGFAYRDTACHAEYVFRDGKWDEGKLVESPYLPVHIAATGLHYGQECFEGIKAFRRKDGRCSIFRVWENAKRMAATAERLCIAPVPEEKFVEACKRVVAANADYIPPYGTGGSLYIRPLLIGTGAQIGVAPAKEYTFLVLVTPVGAYYKGGLQPVKAIVLDDYDRAAPLGTGHIKCGGNYGGSLYAHEMAKHMGYPVELYLDAKTHTFIDEFATSNFLAITKDGKYVTPDSTTVLPSVTNMTLMQLAKDFGMSVERRPIDFEKEIDDFAEVAACGTAVVVTPVNSITRAGKEHRTGPETGCGPVLEKLYHAVQAIQYGEAEDVHGWNEFVDC